jgi:hypothetical protein
MLVHQRPADQVIQLRVKPNADMPDPARLAGMAVEQRVQLLGALPGDLRDPHFGWGDPGYGRRFAEFAGNPPASPGQAVMLNPQPLPPWWRDEMTATELLVLGSRFLAASALIEQEKLRFMVEQLGEKALSLSMQR